MFPFRVRPDHHERQKHIFKNGKQLKKHPPASRLFETVSELFWPLLFYSGPTGFGQIRKGISCFWDFVLDLPDRHFPHPYIDSLIPASGKKWLQDESLNLNLFLKLMS